MAGFVKWKRGEIQKRKKAAKAAAEKKKAESAARTARLMKERRAAREAGKPSPWYTSPEQRAKEMKKAKEKKAAKKPSVTITPAKKKEPTPSKVAPVIKLKPKKKKFEETKVGKAIAKITYGKTGGEGMTSEEKKATARKRGISIGAQAAVGVLGGAAIGGAARLGTAAAKPSMATISASVHAHKLYTTKAGAEKLIGLGTRTATRSFIGKPATIGVQKLFSMGGAAAKRGAVAARYATNTKSMGLTSKILIGAGLSLGAVSIARDVIGTYPFASFGKEEALQVTNFPISKLIDRGLIDQAEALVNMSDEIINTVPSKIPYKNVLQEFNKYVEAQAKANEGWRSVINFEREKVSEEDVWAKRYEEQDARRAKQREDDEEYYAGIQESLASAREEGRAEDERYYAEINEENRKRKEAAEQEELEEMEWKAEYYDLIRQGKYEEAAALLKSKMGGE